MRHEFYTPSEAARILRFSLDHVYRLLATGELPARKIGSAWRIPASAVWGADGPEPRIARVHAGV